jgi:HPt (histidine-containing phosphotransfer) domain-containing protein
MIGGNGTALENGAPPLPCVNLAHLRRYTLGNRDLELEVLHLFVGQAPQTFGQLAAAQDAVRWKIAAHTLKGSARAVGAERIAALAQAAEHIDPRQTERAQIVAELEEAIAEASAFVAGLQKDAAFAEPRPPGLSVTAARRACSEHHSRPTCGASDP